MNLGSHWGFPTYRMTCSGQQKLYINDKKEPEIRDQASVSFFNKSAAKKSGLRQIKFPHYPERLASRCQQNKRKSCSTYYSFSEFFIKTICNILIIGYLAVATAFHLCLSSLLSYSQKSCQGNFKNLTKVGLAVLKKIVIF